MPFILTCSDKEFSKSCLLILCFSGTGVDFKVKAVGAKTLSEHKMSRLHVMSLKAPYNRNKGISMTPPVKLTFCPLGPDLFSHSGQAASTKGQMTTPEIPLFPITRQRTVL